MVKNNVLRLGFLFFILWLFSVNLFGQEAIKFDFEILLDQRIISTSAKQKVKVKFTNLSASDFETRNFKIASFYLLKRGENDFYIADKDLSKIIEKNKLKTLKQNESLEFEVRLNKLKWRDQLQASKKNEKKFKRLIPGRYNFYAVVEISAKKYYGSNGFTVNLIAK